MVPGNHEVDRTKVNEPLEFGLTHMFETEDGFNKFYNAEKLKPDSSSIPNDKLGHYFEFIRSRPFGVPIVSNFFYSVHSLALDNLRVGVVCLNSSWMSSHLGNGDEGRLIIGSDVLLEAIEHLEGVDLKFVLAHHPFEMLKDWDSKSLQRAMAQCVDVFCNGHIHDSDFSYTGHMLGSFHVSTSASLYSGRIRNGYSLLNIDLYERSLNVYLRKWYNERRQFDQETEKCKDGVVSYVQFKCGNDERNELIEIGHLRSEIETEADESKFLVPIELQRSIKLGDIFVEPILSLVPSQAARKRDPSQSWGMEDLLLSKQNLLISGRKEFGKSTLLNRLTKLIVDDDSRFGKYIPIKIKYSKLPKNNSNGIVKIVRQSINGVCSVERIEHYLSSGRFIFLIDDWGEASDDPAEKRKQTFFEFFKAYPDCRYVLTANEKLNLDFREERLALVEMFNVKPLYLSPFNSGKLRELLQKWGGFGSNVELEPILQQIVYYFRRLRMPVTPMAATLFIGILFREGQKKNIRNEAYLIENYLESILEKLDNSERKSDLDFKDKEAFLAHVAIEMCRRDQFEWSPLEFENLKVNYYDKLGEKLPSNQFFEDFFVKGILVEKKDGISFKFKFWFSFFLAKQMQKDAQVKSEILESPGYLRYSVALSYKAGLDRNDLELMQEVDRRTQEAFADLVDRYNSKVFGPEEFNQQLIEFTQEIETEIKEKNVTEDKDVVRDEKYLSYDQEDDPEDEESVIEIDLLTLISDIIRNTTEIELSHKKIYIKNVVRNYCSIMWGTLESVRDLIDQLNLSDVSVLVSHNSTKIAGVERTVEMAKELVLQVVPISIILYMIDHLSSAKLERAVAEVMADETDYVRKLFLALLLMNMNREKALKEVKILVEKSSIFAVHYIVYRFLQAYCYEHKGSEESLNQIIKIMEGIRSKYASKSQNDGIPIRNTFATDFKKDILVRQKSLEERT